MPVAAAPPAAPATLFWIPPLPPRASTPVVEPRLNHESPPAVLAAPPAPTLTV